MRGCIRDGNSWLHSFGRPCRTIQFTADSIDQHAEHIVYSDCQTNSKTGSGKFEGASAELARSENAGGRKRKN